MAGKFNIGDVVSPIKTKSDAGVTLTPQDEVMVTGSSTLLGGRYVFGGRTFHNNSGYTHDIIGDDVDFELVSVANGVNHSSSPLPASSTTAATSPTVAQYFGDGTALQLEEVQNNVEKCECGSSLVGSPYHSTWCPLFKP